jgi:hypothetical protein
VGDLLGDLLGDPSATHGPSTEKRDYRVCCALPRLRTGDPINFWSPVELGSLFGAFDCFRITEYLRLPNLKSLGNPPDASDPWGTYEDDNKIARRHGALLTDQFPAALELMHPHLEMLNLAQLVLFASSDLVVGVQGGLALLGAVVGSRKMLLRCRQVWASHSTCPHACGCIVVVVHPAAPSRAYLTLTLAVVA